MTRTILAATTALALTATAAFAGDDKATVQIFYDLLSNPGSETHTEAFTKVVADDWESVGSYVEDPNTKDGFLGLMGAFSQLVPNIDWKVEAMHQDGNFVTVRSRATGTPAGEFFGVNGEGRSFDIQTIDIHELKDGVIVRSYHVEDWAGALQQLSGS